MPTISKAKTPLQKASNEISKLSKSSVKRPVATQKSAKRAKPVGSAVEPAPAPSPSAKATTATKATTAVAPKIEPRLKAKLVRDSFTLPETDHDLIKQCKKHAIASGRETKKSEVVRAAIQVFAALSVAQQLAAYEKLQSISVGRPKSK